MKTNGFDSNTLKIIMICALVIMLGGLIGGYFYTQDWLLTYAIDVNKTSSELAQRENVQAQTTLATSLNSFKPAIDKSASFVSTASTYLDITKRDVNKYASELGIEVTEISPTQSDYPQNSTAVAGLQNQYVKVTLKNPVTFTNLVKFIKGIETNTPKMRLTGVNLTHAPGDSDKISVDPLTLEVYTR